MLSSDKAMVIVPTTFNMRMGLSGLWEMGLLGHFADGKVKYQKRNGCPGLKAG